MQRAARYGLLASLLVATPVLATVLATPALASECPGNPGALGTSRTIVVDPSQHMLLGGHQYRESLPLNDKEVVITFDDGPLPPYSTRVLDILAQECVKATFFLVGRMARSFPNIVKRIHDEGHTLANHSQSHPFNFHTMSVADAAREIEDGFASIGAAVGDPAKVAPFFRFPGLLRQDSVEHYLRSKQVMAWSVDFMGDDWRRINAREINRRVLERLEAKGKGILLLHDIQPATALGLAELLRELKARGYRIVHVVPSGAGRPATVTTAEQWAVRGAGRGEVAQGGGQGGVNVWPRVLPHRVSGVTTLSAPSVMSFGAETPDDDVPVTLVSAPAPLRGSEGEVALPVWPQEVITIAVLPEIGTLPAPAADNFRYHRINRGRAAKGAKKDKQDKQRRPNREITHSTSADITGSIGTTGAGNGERKAGKSAKSETSKKSEKKGKASPNGKAAHSPTANSSSANSSGASSSSASSSSAKAPKAPSSKAAPSSKSRNAGSKGASGHQI
jgi:peptidoglycan/xylan/chitin deacetylase (PgdA/CDA1 family)